MPKPKEEPLKLGRVRVETKKVSQLIPAPYNPRKIQAEAREGLRGSLEEFGLTEPLIWNEVTGHLIGGHQRLDILKEQGVEEVDVSVLHIEDIRKEKALNAVLNNEAAMGEFTEQALEILQEIEQQAPDLYDKLLFSRIEEEVEERLGESAKQTGGEGLAAMALRPYEHLDYIVLLFKDVRDWNNASEHFGLKQVKEPIKRSRIGVGRVIDGATYLRQFTKKGK